MKKPVFYIVLLFSAYACSKPVSQEELIETAIQIRLQQWRIEQADLCRERAITAAAEYVDSMMIVTSLDTKLDTIPKPPKPNKPPKPTFKPTPDSLVIEELKKNG